MSLPKEPRQKMINLMYLVLTALLALNVSNEILNAFRTLSSSINKSNVSIDQRNKELYEQIIANEAQPGQQEKVRPYRLKADDVVKQANDMVAYLDSWKKRIVMEAGGYAKDKDGKSPEDTVFPDRMDNIDATTLLLVEKKGGDSLKNRIEQMRTYLLSMISPNEQTAIDPLMPLRVEKVKPNDHNPTGDWSIGNFEHMPAIAALALFSKYQNDVRASEALIIKQLYDDAHSKDIKFDTIMAVAVPKQSYALEGDKIEATILLAAFNRHLNPTIGNAGGGSTKPAVNGVIAWETVASGTGLKTVNGTLNLKNEQGQEKSYPWKFDYMVGTTGASMQLDKMNVFYIGVPNPVTVAAAGYSVEDVSLSIPGATVTGEKGHYSVTVSSIGTVNVAINAKTKEGSIKQVGGMPVRVKRIPDPVARLGKVAGGAMSAALFRVQVAPGAYLDNFDFDARFTITHFSVMVLPKGKDIQGPFPVTSAAGCRFSENPDLVKMMTLLRPGDRVFIDEIKAVGPDKMPRSLPGIALLLN